MKNLSVNLLLIVATVSGMLATGVHATAYVGADPEGAGSDAWGGAADHAETEIAVTKSRSVTTG